MRAAKDPALWPDSYTLTALLRCLQSKAQQGGGNGGGSSSSNSSSSSSGVEAIREPYALVVRAPPSSSPIPISHLYLSPLALLTPTRTHTHTPKTTTKPKQLRDIQVLLDAQRRSSQLYTALLGAASAVGDDATVETAYAEAKQQMDAGFMPQRAFRFVEVAYRRLTGRRDGDGGGRDGAGEEGGQAGAAASPRKEAAVGVKGRGRHIF